MGELGGTEAVTVLAAVAVLAVGRLVVYRLGRPQPPAEPADAGDGEATRELPVVDADPVWRSFYATASRRRRWPLLGRRRP